MRMLHITNRLSEGGVETFLLNLLPALKSQGIDVELLVLDSSAVSLKEDFENKGIKVHVGKYSSVYNFLNVITIINYINDYDIIHSHLFPTQYYLSFAKFITLSKKTIITTEHCTTNKRRRFPFRLLESWIYLFYSKIICVSDAASINLRNWIISSKKNKVVTVYNGISLDKVFSAIPYDKVSLGLDSNCFLVGMTARFFDQKDQDTLIKSMVLLPDDIYLILIGSGERQENCMNLVASLALEKRVLFLGRRDDVPSIIKCLDLCVLSTHYEGLPVSIIEYMAAGKAVVATDVDGVREMLVEKHFLSDENNSDSLAQRILYFYNNPDYLNEVSKRNLINSHKYNLNSMVNKYLEIYLKLD